MAFPSSDLTIPAHFHALLDELRGLRRDIQRFTDATSNSFDLIARELREISVGIQDVKEISNYMLALNHNKQARRINRSLRSVEEVLLTPMVSLLTYDTIPHFPRTGQDVYGLTEGQLDSVLRHLMILNQSNLEYKRRYLEWAIGVRNIV